VLGNHGQRLRARFGRDGVSVTSGGLSVGLSVRAYGYGALLHPLAAVAPRAQANLVLYRRAALSEWYANGPLGLEQGFTISAPPAGRRAGPLTLALALSGNSRGELSISGRQVTFTRGRASLAYRGLVATDARGRTLRAWMGLRGNQLMLRISDAGASFPIKVDPFVQQAKLTASDGAATDLLSHSVAVSGDTIVTGAPFAKIGANTFQGAAYVFTKPATGWANATEAAKLTASDGGPFDQLGWTVALSGDTVVAGAPDAKVGSNPNQGAAYVFTKPASGWASETEAAKLTASDGAADDDLGTSVAVSGDTVVAGAPDAKVGSNPNQGAAYVFTKPASGWASETEAAKLTASDGGSFDQLGASVAVSGDSVVAGAPGARVGPNTGPGAAYVFTKPASGWVSETEAAKLTASDGAANDLLGASVAVSGDTVVAGAPDAKVGSNAFQGAAYVFTKPVSGWASETEAAKLTASDGGAGDQLGSSVAVSGDTIVAGAPFAKVGSNTAQGAAYVFGPSQHPTSTSVSCSPGTVAVGQSTTCTATVTDTASGGQTTPTGTVSFSSDSSGTFSPGTSCTLSGSGSSASCSVSYAPSSVNSGTHTITADYGGDSTHATSSGATTVTVTKRSTSTSVSCAPGTVAVGQSTACTATVADTGTGTQTTPSGTVSFTSSGPGSFGGSPCTLSGSGPSASCTVAYMPGASGTLRSDTITASYSGDSTHQTSNGSTAVAVQPTSKADCLSGGYQNYGFKDQGACIKFVHDHGG
jgi:hypothetical protein